MDSSKFVQRKGLRLVLNGQTFKFAGASNYYMLTRAVEKVTKPQVRLLTPAGPVCSAQMLLHHGLFSKCHRPLELHEHTQQYTAQVSEVFETAQKLGITVVRVWAFNDGDTWNALQPRMGHIDERVLKCRLCCILADLSPRA